MTRDCSGVPGLDYILAGGLPQHRLYLLEGSPGTGKTTLALQFLLAGAVLGQTSLYITLSETREELEEVAASHGWTLDKLHLFDATEAGLHFQEEDHYTVLSSDEVELTELTQELFKLVERLNPARVVFDSISDLRLLARDSLRYRRQVLAIKYFFSGRQSTILLLDDLTAHDQEQQLQSIAHGVIRLERLGKEYGPSRRFLQVVKMRGVRFQDGTHDYTIECGGLNVFPRLIASESRQENASETISSGIPELDALTGGGLDCGASTLMLGPPGTGKSNLATQYIFNALQAGNHAAAYIFEESATRFYKRAAGIGLDVRPFEQQGRFFLRQVDTAELSPGEFVTSVRNAVEQKKTKVVLIDSLSGYMTAMPNERFVLAQMYEVLSYLNNKGVLTIITLAQQGLIGPMSSSIDLSYLADTILLLRYFEAEGAVRQALSVIKRREGFHERTIRELKISSQGICIGDPLVGFSGVLTGVPRYSGVREELIGNREHSK